MFSSWILSQLILIGIFQAVEAVLNGPEQLSPEVGELPYMVEILDTISVEKIACGGAIIDPTHILTAAHCLITTHRDRLTIIAGTIDVFSESRTEQQGVAKFFVHHKFAMNGTLWHQSSRWKQIRKWFRDTLKCSDFEVNDNFLEYDIAVLKLNEALPIGDNIRLVNLPSPDSSPVCQHCIFAGWGQIEINGPSSRRLYATKLLVLAPQVCETWFTKLPSNELCAIHLNAESMPLKGDSGAPLVMNNTVYGVASRVRRNNPRYPSVFTKVSAHLKWIRTVLKK